MTERAMHMCKLDPHLFSGVCNPLLIESVNLDPVELWSAGACVSEISLYFSLHCSALSSSGLCFCIHLFCFNFFLRFLFILCMCSCIYVYELCGFL